MVRQAPTRPEFALACADSIIRIYDLATCQELRRSPGRFPQGHLAYSPVRKKLAIASFNQPSEIVDIHTWETLTNIAENSPLAGVYLAIAQQRSGETDAARRTFLAAREVFARQRHPSPVEPREFDAAVKEAIRTLGEPTP